MQGVKWLFFDLGSTLLDESQVYEDIFRKIAISANVSKAIVNQKAVAFYKQNKRGDKEVARFFNVSFPEWEPKLEVLYTETKMLLKTLHDKYKIGIIANQLPGTEERLQAFGIRKYIDVIAASSDEGVAKPDKRLFQIALEKADCAPEQAVMIGDRIDNDIVPAKESGMKTIWIKQGPGRYWKISCEKETPDYEVSGLLDLLKIL